MLKIKDNVNLQELKVKYNLAYDNDSDYEGGWSYETLDKDGVFLDLWDRQIFGIDKSKLDLLYDLIKAGLVEKVGEEKEDKKIEKLETYKEIDDEEHYANILKVSKNGEYEINEALSVVVDKINEIIDKLNEMSDKE